MASIKTSVATVLLVTASFSVVHLQGQRPGSTPQAPEPEPAVVTVSAQQLPLDKISASVSVISRSDIEASQAETIVELLQHTPFVYVSQIGGRGGLSTASIRGGDANFTLIMIDGIPLNDPTNILGGSFDLAALSLDRIDRIEVVRGPMSVRHGSEAIAGVINIITRKGEGTPEAGRLTHGNWEFVVTAGSKPGTIPLAFPICRLANRLKTKIWSGLPSLLTPE